MDWLWWNLMCGCECVVESRQFQFVNVTSFSIAGIWCWVDDWDWRHHLGQQLAQSTELSNSIRWLCTLYLVTQSFVYRHFAKGIISPFTANLIQHSIAAFQAVNWARKGSKPYSRREKTRVHCLVVSAGGQALFFLFYLMELTEPTEHFPCFLLLPPLEPTYSLFLSFGCYSDEYSPLTFTL